MIQEILWSWKTKQGIHTNDEVLSWIKGRNETLDVQINKISLEQCRPWFYDAPSGSIINETRSFFSICGIRQRLGDEAIAEQPIILQNEIGFLGILCKRIDGMLHFLMQAKIEPGNVNTIQLSPTIQATKSNFTQMHGGSKPAYLEFFLCANPTHIIVDQIQSEQSSRFYKKRNRNMIIYLDDDANIEILPGYRWMTLGQVKAFMRFENIVNMDARTVLSCIPVSLMAEDKSLGRLFEDEALFRSMVAPIDVDVLRSMYHHINNYKMFNEKRVELVDLFSLEHWCMDGDMFVSKHAYPFRIIFCDIAIEGREVRRWKQPLFEAVGQALFGLLCCEDAGKMKFLVQAQPEIGCLDAIELGPSIQRESVYMGEDNVVDQIFFKQLSAGSGILFDTMLSEEGGRFYHEQNRNVIIKIDKQDIHSLPDGYIWTDYSTLNMLTQVNNCLNIQLRNLLSLLEV